MNTITTNGKTHDYADLDVAIASFLASFDTLDKPTRRRLLLSVCALLVGIQRAA